MTFTGVINGDEIVFAWELHIRNGGAPPNLRESIRFGTSAPPSFTTKRVPDGDLAALADQPRGIEYAAAINLPEKDVKVEGRLLLPQRVGRVRAVIVAVYWGLGPTFFENARVRSLLDTESGILLARFSSMGPSAQQSANIFTAQAADGLLLLLQRLAQESAHRELTDASLLFWGHSAGGSCGPMFAAIYPERTIAFVLYQSSAAGRMDNLKILSPIPALIFADNTITTGTAFDSEALLKRGRSVGGPWARAAQDADHGSDEYFKKANDLQIPWITAILRQRLSPNGTSLRAVSDGAAWLANDETGEVAPYASFSGSKADASWLPDEASARGWQAVRDPAK